MLCQLNKKIFRHSTFLAKSFIDGGGAYIFIFSKGEITKKTLRTTGLRFVAMD